MIRTCIAAAAALSAAVTLATPTHAGEVYGGVYAHAVDTPFTLETGESGTDLQFGYRFDPALGPLRIEPYVFGSVNLDGNTDFAGAGVSRKIPIGLIYVRPGVGLVVHDAPSYRVDMATGYRTDLGSRVLFEPEIAVGTRIAPRLTLEASWVHISNARLFNSEQNPGIDTIGLRLNLHL